MRKDVVRVNFTDQWVRECPAPATGRQSYYDAESTSLVLIVTKNGSKTFYRAGRPSRVFIGKPDRGWTVALARKKCNLIVGQIASGKDPVRIRRRKRNQITLGKAWEWYLEHHAKKHKRTWRCEVYTWNGGLIEWADRKLIDITRVDFVERLNHLIAAKGEGHARHQMKLLNAIFTQAKLNGLVKRRPGRGVPLPKARERNRYLTEAELPRLFAALPNRSQDFQDLIRIALFTGARRSNVYSMEFKEITKTTWTIPTHKAKEGKPISIPLVAEVMEIIKRRVLNGSEFVFPSRGASGHMVSCHTQWDALLKEAKLTNFRFHDLRHTTASYQVGAGVSLEIIGAALGHTDHKSTKRYATVAPDPVRAAMEAGAEAIQKSTAAKKSKKSRK